MEDVGSHVDELVQRDLFGGAVLMNFPLRFTDVSDFRPVPDSQEVYADASHDQSLIIEVVEHSSTVVDNDAAAYYLNDLATQNEATVSSVSEAVQLDTHQVPGVPGASFKGLVSGMQLAAKGRQGGHAANEVLVLLLVVRLPDHGSDLLISMNTPSFINPTSSAAEHAGAGAKPAYVAAPALFQQIISTLRIVDYSLFGE